MSMMKRIDLGQIVFGAGAFTGPLDGWTDSKKNHLMRWLWEPRTVRRIQTKACAKRIARAQAEAWDSRWTPRERWFYNGVSQYHEPVDRCA